MKAWGIVFGNTSLDTNQKSPKIKFKKISLSPSPFNLFSKIYKQYDYSYLLESMEGPEKLARYSFIGFNPQSIISIRSGEMKIYNKRDDATSKSTINDPLTSIKDYVNSNLISYNGLRFIGGLVGYISYDAIRYWEILPKITIDDLQFPDIKLAIYDDGIIFDHEKHIVLYYYYSRDRSNELENLMLSSVEIQPLECTHLELNLSKELFEEKVSRAKEYIAAGDILQVVLSKRYGLTIRGDLLAFYGSLREINPSPYMYFLKMKDQQIVGSSPEMLVRVENRMVETYPIAGTRPHVNDREKNKELARELLADPKEQAEHLMLVDLARNDVGKVSEFGSVHVPQFMEVREYSHVQHIVSRVIGKLKPRCDSFDALRAIFPAGTVSGAPKVRAMEIIEESEPTRRGPYAGAVGYFSFNGNSDFAITIRTLVAKENKAYIQVGAGIVADSVPEREWFETDHKAQALIKALNMSGRNYC